MRTLVLGLGNILLRDEGVGVRVVEALAERYALPAEVEVVDGGTAGMDLLNTLAGCDHLLICDAVRTSEPPGSVVKLVGEQIPALFQTRCSPHQLGLSDLLATLTLTGEAPATVTLIGIIPADLRLGLELSAEAAEAAGGAVEELAAELRELGYPLGPKRLAAGAAI